jgi:hypothetical protein
MRHSAQDSHPHGTLGSAGVAGAGAVARVEGGTVTGAEVLAGLVAAGAVVGVVGGAATGAAGGGAGQEWDRRIPLSSILFQDSYLYSKGYSLLRRGREWSMS